MPASAIAASPSLPADDSPVSGGASATERTAARTAGIALAVMAVAAPLGLLVALPTGATGLAALTALVVAMFDVVVGVALYVVLRPAGHLLAGCTAALRLAYAAAFASAAGWLLGDADVARFEAAWNAALLVFGAHLELVGIAVVRAAGMPSWVGALAALAGVGYLVDSVSVALEVPLSVSEFSFVGEVVLLGWLLVRGLRRGAR